MIKCPNCGRDNAVNFNFCLDCGYDLKAYREAFPDGIPAPPPPPAPAMTMPTGQAFSADLPYSHTPGASLSPLPPLPARPDQRVDSPQIPSTPPPTFSTPPSPLSSLSSAAPFPPLPTISQPLTESSSPPPSLQSSLPSAPTPGPYAAPALNTGSLAASSMPAPALSAPPAPVTIPPQHDQSSWLPSSGTPAPVSVPSQVAPQATLTPMSAARPCASCSYENLPTVKFCGNCGKRLDGAAASSTSEPEAGAGRTMFMHAADMQGLVKEKLCKLITIDQSGREGMTFTIKNGETICGRVNGIILFFDDPYVSPTHCKFSFYSGQLKVTDQNSLNGVYVRVKQERRLTDGELIRVGRQLFRFESMQSAAFQVKKVDGDDSRIWGSPAPTAFGRLVQILDDGRTGEIRLLTGDRCQLGREIGDIVMPTDGFISGRHCVFTHVDGEAVLTDLGSINGTYIRVREHADVAHGDFVLVGNQMLRVEIA